MSWLNSQWYSKRPSRVWASLLPLEFLYRSIIFLRRTCYRLGLLRAERLPVPVIIVGNLSVGGVGKTPLTAALVDFFQRHHFRPGIISRGYKGKASSWPQLVTADSDPHLLGDEPVLLAQKTACPVVVGPKRVEAAKRLLESFEVDVLIADDGLQHYALERDIEIAVVDAERGFGNGHCLPYGPLREPKARLETVDFIVSNGLGISAVAKSKQGHEHRPNTVAMQIHAGDLFRLNNPREKKALSECQSKPVHAFAGIGHPQRFFDALRRHGLSVIEHAFADHYRFKPKDFAGLAKTDCIIMTEKDAVKCRFLKDDRIWVLPIEAKLPAEFFTALLKKLP